MAAQPDEEAAPSSAETKSRSLTMPVSRTSRRPAKTSLPPGSRGIGKLIDWFEHAREPAFVKDNSDCNVGSS